MSTEKKQLPPISSLFKDSWATFVASLQQIFLLNILSIIAIAVVGMIGASLFIATLGPTLLKSPFTSSSMESFFNSIPSSTILALGLTVTVGFISLIIIQSVTNIAVIMILDKKGAVSLKETIQKSLTLIIPMLIVGFLTSFMIFGGLFVFVLPGIYIALLLMFAGYEVILNNQRFLGALKQSVSLISASFGAIFVRAFAFWLIYFLIVFILPNSMNSQNSQPNGSLFILSFIVNLLLGWFMMSYMITLYKQVKAHAGDVKPKNIGWMFIVAVGGYILFGVLMAGMFNFVRLIWMQNATKNNMNPYQYQQISPYPTGDYKNFQ